MGWLIGNNKRAFAEKLMKDIRAREEKEKIDVIGDVSPEIKEKRTAENVQMNNSKKMQEIREEREKEDDKKEGQLLAIHGAKVKFNSHMGEFKVLNDVPTTQGKLTGTIVEKQIANFTFYDGFQMLSLTEWQDFGTVNVQDNFALLKKSTLPGTGKMPGNVPPESGKIEFVDSGQVNVPESITTTGAPVPENDIKVNGYFYNYNGNYEGRVTEQKNGNENDVYACDGKDKEKDTFVNAKKLKITHEDFIVVCDVIMKEAGKDDLIELKCIAFTSYNRSVKAGKSWKTILASSYSCVPNKSILSDTTNNSKANHTREAIIAVLNHENDITRGAEYWDGTDFLAWGADEETPYKTEGHAKFRQYKFIEIPKAIYDKFIAAHNSQSIYTIKPKSKHDPKHDSGKHQHFTKKDKNGNMIDKAKYPIPSAVFKDTNNWKTGNFYYETGVKDANGISGTITAGESIFWKITTTKLLK